MSNRPFVVEGTATHTTGAITGSQDSFPFPQPPRETCTHQALTFYRGTKIVVGTQIGILSIFNRSSGWGDCVDRVPGFVFIFSHV